MFGDERSVAVRRAIDQLPTRARLAVVLRWQHQMSHAEVAAAMGISNKGVEKLLSTAKAKLRVLLGVHADELTSGD
jgi:RNA polymerase sigma factor (sigma-70 family)